jgi:hypothetical protein
MKHLEPYDFPPNYQPDEADAVSFRLEPLDLKSQYELQATMNRRGIPSWDGIQIAAQRIVGWSGKQLGDFSAVRVKEILRGGASANWMIWLGEIAGELYSRSLIGADAEKKS